MRKFSKKDGGFTLLETIISIGIFFVISIGIYFSYVNVMRAVSGSSLHLTTLTIIQNEFEGIRNMAYEDVGIVGGSPPGKIPAEKAISYGGTPYTVKTYIRNVDDPFDGTFGGTPNDSAPADYKIVEVEVSCDCASGTARMTTTISPLHLESATKNGALFINVFNASGQPVSGANIHIYNHLLTPSLTIDDTSNINGTLQLVDIATSSFGYEISVSKTGYSSDRTYQPGLLANPNPTKPHATVAKQQVTTISFVIDRLASLNFKTADAFCRPVGNIDFQQIGNKLIGTDPNVPKYSATLATNANGLYSNSALEWDTYNFTNLDSSYDVAGIFQKMPLAVDPGATANLTWLVEPKSPMSALLVVKNQNGELINDAVVTLSKTGYSSSQHTGRKKITYTDWSNGQYSQKSPNLSVSNPLGELTLGQIGGHYASMSQEWLESETIDFGSNDTAFYNLEWNPTSQPSSAGPDSLKFQLAANNDNSTWNFVGPDGTSGTYYTTSGTMIGSAINGNRYLRYKAYLSTQDDAVTPSLQDLSLNFHSGCIPDGQTFFTGLTTGTYTLTVEKSGYATYSNPAFSIAGQWQEFPVTITP